MVEGCRLNMQRRVRRLTSHLFVICRRQCSAEATGSVPGNDDLVSIGKNGIFRLMHALIRVFEAYFLAGDVSVRVQNPKMPHLVPHSFDQRMCLGPSGVTVFCWHSLLSYNLIRETLFYSNPTFWE